MDTVKKGGEGLGPENWGHVREDEAPHTKPGKAAHGTGVWFSLARAQARKGGVGQALSTRSSVTEEGIVGVAWGGNGKGKRNLIKCLLCTWQCAGPCSGQLLFFSWPTSFLLPEIASGLSWMGLPIPRLSPRG